MPERGNFSRGRVRLKQTLFQSIQIGFCERSLHRHAQLRQHRVKRLHYSLQLRRIRIFPHVSNPDYLAFQHIKGSSQHNVILFTHRRQNRSRGRLLRYVKHRHCIRIPIARMQLQSHKAVSAVRTAWAIFACRSGCWAPALIFSKAALKPRISLMGMVIRKPLLLKIPVKGHQFA